MSDEALELGELVNAHETAHDRVAALREDLASRGQQMATLADNLRQHPEEVDETALLAVLEPENLARLLREFRTFSTPRRIAPASFGPLDRGYIVDGLKTRRAAPAASRERDLFAKAS